MGHAAQFHGGSQHIIGRAFQKSPAHRGRTGERKLAQAIIGKQWLRNRRCRLTGYDVKHPLWKPSIDHGLGKILRCQRSQLGRLEHHCATRCNRGGYLARRHRQRKVPRGDQQAGTHRLAASDHPQRAFGNNCSATVIAHRFLTEPTQELAAVSNLTLSFRKGLTHL